MAERAVLTRSALAPFFLKQICDEAARGETVWQEKLIAKLDFRIWSYVELR
jgi:hypothetical protein